MAWPQLERALLICNRIYVLASMHTRMVEHRTGVCLVHLGQLGLFAVAGYIVACS